MVNVLCIGSSGFVGHEILSQLLENDSIENVTCLSRRVIRVVHPKLKNIIHSDFAEYSDELLKDLADQNDICYWTIGGKSGDFSTLEEYERVSVQFTVNFLNGLCTQLKRINDCNTNGNNLKRFTFVYCSGMGADIRADQSWLPIQTQTRIIKATVENKLIEIQQDNQSFLSLLIFRPGGIIPQRFSHGGTWFFKWLFSSFIIGVYELSNVMIEKSTQLYRVSSSSNSSNNNNNKSNYNNNNNNSNNGSTSTVSAVYSNNEIYYTFYKDGWCRNRFGYY